MRSAERHSVPNISRRPQVFPWASNRPGARLAFLGFWEHRNIIPSSELRSIVPKTPVLPILGNRAGSKSRRLARDKAYPQLRSSYSHAEMLRSIPVRWSLLGRIAACLVQPVLPSPAPPVPERFFSPQL